MPIIDFDGLEIVKNLVNPLKIPTFAHS